MLHSNISSTILYACCDSTSKVMGTALGPEIIRNKLKNNNIAHEIKVSVKNEKSSFDYCKQIERIAELNNLKLTIGGEHLITFPILAAMARKISKLKLVIFDAHHDAYPYPISTHYSLFYHVWLELKLPMFFIGTRYEVERSFGSISILDWKDIESQSTRWSFEKIMPILSNLYQWSLNGG